MDRERVWLGSGGGGGGGRREPGKGWGQGWGRDTQSDIFLEMVLIIH